MTGNPSFSGNENDPLNTPLGAVIDYHNTLYIADSSNNRIQKI